MKKTVEAMQHLLEEPMSSEELEVLSSRIERALVEREGPEEKEALVAELSGRREWSPRESASLELSALRRSFRRRRWHSFLELRARRRMIA